MGVDNFRIYSMSVETMQPPSTPCELTSNSPTEIRGSRTNPTSGTSLRKGSRRTAKQYACWLLGIREWSAKELESKLCQKDFAADEIKACLAFCQENGLQSDARFAESRVRMRSRVHGNRRIALELVRKGIDPEGVQAALGKAEDEECRALAAAQRFSGKAMTPEMRAKAWRFLSTRGFSGSSIRNALTSLAQAQS